MILWVSVAANAPPALVLNENVAALEALEATRSVEATMKMGLVTWPSIAPDEMVVGLELASAEV